MKERDLRYDYMKKDVDTAKVLRECQACAYYKYTPWRSWCHLTTYAKDTVLFRIVETVQNKSN